MSDLTDRLDALADEIGGLYKIDRFDGGGMITLTVPGRGSKSVTVEYGDTLDPADQLRALFAEEAPHLYRLTYEDGTVAEVRATDLGRATLMVGRGAPDKTEDLGIQP